MTNRLATRRSAAARRRARAADRRRTRDRSGAARLQSDGQDQAGQERARTATSSRIPTPPTVTPVDKLPLDKIKLPAGFKAEVWSSGHPGGRTMVMGDKGTMFMGTRVIGRVYAHHRQGRQARGQDAADRV